MTALPMPPGRLLTITEYAALGEDDQYRWELQEGNLVMSPSPSPRHPPASLLAHHLAGEFGYADNSEVTGTFSTSHPYPLTIDLSRLG